MALEAYEHLQKTQVKQSRMEDEEGWRREAMGQGLREKAGEERLGSPPLKVASRLSLLEPVPAALQTQGRWGA